jgi:hypothetical protein
MPWHVQLPSKVPNTELLFAPRYTNLMCHPALAGFNPSVGYFLPPTPTTTGLAPLSLALRPLRSLSSPVRFLLGSLRSPSRSISRSRSLYLSLASHCRGPRSTSAALLVRLVTAGLRCARSFLLCLSRSSSSSRSRCSLSRSLSRSWSRRLRCLRGVSESEASDDNGSSDQRRLKREDGWSGCRRALVGALLFSRSFRVRELLRVRSDEPGKNELSFWRMPKVPEG